MQYFKPDGGFFVGDCMPFCHAGTFRLFYLLDENHHGALGGLGGHQWAQASSRDLVHWEHHPLAIGITEDREGSICTGSVFFHAGTYYGFYATRMRDKTQHLSLAKSRDGIHFEKTDPNPFASPPAGYDPFHYRDPVVFQDPGDGLFHMLATARLVNGCISDRGGCLAHLVSSDLQRWEVREPFAVPGLPGEPECPDYFFWNGWHYFMFSNGGVTRYKMSRQPFGPWLRPKVDTLDGPAARVMKTAAFGDGRRIGVAWIGTRRDSKDDGPFQFGGNAIFRELVQHEDGTLGAKFPAEMTPTGNSLSAFDLCPLDPDTKIIEGHRIHVAPRQGLGVAQCSGIPHNAHLSLRVIPQPGSHEFGLRLRSGNAFDTGYQLHFTPRDNAVNLQRQWIGGVDGLDHPFVLEIALRDDIIDVCIAGSRTLIDRCPERRGDKLLLYAQDSAVTFEVVEIAALP
jgi:hypothetical protein